MNKIKSEKRLCLICMEEHEVDILEVAETEIFKNEEVSFIATYEYCSNADEYLETEEMVKVNSLAMKDAYREKVGLLTSAEIMRKMHEEEAYKCTDSNCLIPFSFAERLNFGD